MTQHNLFGDPIAEIFIVTDDDFEKFWLSGAWRKIGKKEAYRSFRKTVKTKEDFGRIQRARDNYAADLKANPRNALHGSTFFNLWEDFADLKVAPATPTKSLTGENHGRFARFVQGANGNARDPKAG